MVPALAVAAYVAGWFITARIIYGLPDDKPPGCDGDRMTSAGIALCWPFIAAVCALLLIMRLPTVGAVSHTQRAERQHEMRVLLEQRGERVAELERELGIGDKSERLTR